LVLTLVLACAFTELPQLVARFFQNDFHIADLYYQVRPDDQDPLEEEVVLVNVGPTGRADIARMIFTLARYQPKVIALDLIFKGERDSVGDGMLQYVLANTPQVILIAESHPKAAGPGDSLVLSHPMFAQFSAHGIGENLMDANVGRRIQKVYRFADGDSALHFAVQTVMLYDSALALAFLQRGEQQENIYFLGNVGGYDEVADRPMPSKFSVLEVDDVLGENFTPDLVEGKIVMMGYMGSYAGDPYTVEDKFFSPLAAYFPVKLAPDMFGVVFHANTVSMILRGGWIDAMGRGQERWLAAGLGALNMALFLLLLRGRAARKWYWVLSSLLIAGELALYPWLALRLFHEHRYLLELSSTVYVILISGYATKTYMYPLLQWCLPSWRNSPAAAGK
jgi:CHASE2 domain-containing sensor protein